eukprot:4742644-Pleurochrysis_carterae.AAC.1
MWRCDGSPALCVFDDYSVGTSNPSVKPLQSSRTTEKAIRTGSIQGMSRQKVVSELLLTSL